MKKSIKKSGKIDTDFLSSFFKVKSNKKNHLVKNLGFTNSTLNDVLTFADSKEYLNDALKKDNIKSIVTNTTNKISTDKSILFTENPRHLFYQIHNYLLNHTNFYGAKQKNLISKSSKIHKSCWIGANNVSIGKNVVIGPNVCIFENTIIDDDVVIKPNTVIGNNGFQSYRFKEKIISIPHGGGVHINKEVEIGSNSCIDKGLFKEKTIIGLNTKIDNLVHIAHNVKIGKNCIIVAHSLLGGSSILDDNVYIAMSATIRDSIKIGRNAIVGMGAVVTNNVADEETVIGVPAHPQ